MAATQATIDSAPNADVAITWIGQGGDVVQNCQQQWKKRDIFAPPYKR